MSIDRTYARPVVTSATRARVWLAASLAVLVAVTAARTQGLDLGLGGEALAGTSHVEWKVRVEPAKVAPGGEFTLVAEYDLADGWHLYAPDHTGTGTPTVIDVEGEGIEPAGEWKYPEPEEKKVVLLDEETHRLLGGDAAFRRTYRVAADAAPGELALRVLLDYMTCDDANCDLPVFDEPHAATLTVTGDASAGDAVAEEAPAETAPTADATSPRIDPLGGGLRAGAAAKSGSDYVTWALTVEPANGVAAGGAFEVVAKFTVQDGLYIGAPGEAMLGASPTTISIESPHVVATDTVSTKPAPEMKEGPLGDELPILRGTGEIRARFDVRRLAEPGDVDLDVKVSFQACDAQLCYPGTHSETLALRIAPPPGARSDDGPGVTSMEPVGPPTTAGDDESAPPEDAAPEAASSDPLTSDAAAREDGAGSATRNAVLESDAVREIVDASFWKLILLMIGGALFALVMPCTYPMIPITISVFTKIADSRKGSVLPVALAYGVGIIASFVIVGLLAATVIQDVATDPGFNLIIGVVFFLFALSFFGVFTLRLPSAVGGLASRFAGTTSYAGVFALGATLCITSFTCTAPIMGPLLIVASQSAESTARVAVSMSVFGATMALPFVLLSLFPSRVRALPRSGGWMNTVKIFLGFVELAASLEFISVAERVLGKNGGPLGILPREGLLVAWAAIFGVAGLYLLGVFRMKDEEPKGIGGGRLITALLSIGLALYLLLGTQGYRLNAVIVESQLPTYGLDTFAPAAAGVSASPSSPDDVARDASEGIPPAGFIVEGIEEGIELATREGMPMFVDFTGPTCKNCILMEQGVFPRYPHLLGKYVQVRLNTDNTHPKFQEHRNYGVKLAGTVARPVYVIVDPAAPLDAIDIFAGADLAGDRFAAFLERNLEAWDARGES